MESGMKDNQRAAPCPWCGAAVPMSGNSFGWPSEEGFLRCRCGAVGLPTFEPEADRFHVAGEVLGIPQRLWADQAWGLQRVEWRITERRSRLQKLEQLVSGQEVWLVILWGRRRTQE